MRSFGIIAAISLLCHNVAAVCTCPDQVAKAVQCKSTTDFACLCTSTYAFDLQTCFASGSSCSDSDEQAATKSYYAGCSQVNEKEPVPTISRSSRSSTTVTTSTESSSSSTSSSASTTSATESASVTDAAAQQTTTPTTPTNPPDEMDMMRRKLKNYKLIGGIVGGVMGLIIIVLAISIFFLIRHFRQKMIEEKKKAEEEASHFIQEGFRNPSPANHPSAKRVYSLQRPLSYALGEYNSSEHEGPSAEKLSLLGPHHAMISTPSSVSSRSERSGNVSSRSIPASPMSQVAESMVARKPVGTGLSVQPPHDPTLDDAASVDVHYSDTPTHERHMWESRPTTPAQFPDRQ